MNTSKHRLIFCFIVLSVILSFIAPVFAQGMTDVKTVSDPDLALSVSNTRQDYPSKMFTVELTILSKINSSKVGVEWRYPKDILKAEGEDKDFVSVTANQKTIVRKNFFPVESVINKDLPDSTVRKAPMSVKVNAFLAERNYLSTTAFEINFNKMMEIIPLDRDYQLIKFGTIALNWAWKIFIVLAIVSVLIFAIRRFIKYLNSDDKLE